VGYFDTLNGQTIRYVAKWNGSVWSQVGTGLPADGDVEAICIDDSDNIYIGGGFYSIPAGGPRSFAKLDKADNTWKPVGDDFNGRVSTIVRDSSGNLYVGGYFTESGANTGFNCIAKWNGASWSKLGTGLTIASGTSYVNTLCLNETGTELWIQGSFDTAGGTAVTAGNWAIYNLSTGVWSDSGKTNMQPIMFKANGAKYVNPDLTGGTGLIPGGNVEFYDPFLASWGKCNKPACYNSDGIPFAFGRFSKISYHGPAPAGEAREATAENLAYWNGSDWEAFVGGTSSMTMYNIDFLLFSSANGDLWATGPETSGANYKLIRMKK